MNYRVRVFLYSSRILRKRERVDIGVLVSGEV
jgi:hypothetical protein